MMSENAAEVGKGVKDVLQSMHRVAKDEREMRCVVADWLATSKHTRRDAEKGCGFTKGDKEAMKATESKQNECFDVARRVPRSADDLH